MPDRRPEPFTPEGYPADNVEFVRRAKEQMRRDAVGGDPTRRLARFQSALSAQLRAEREQAPASVRTARARG